MNIVSKLKAIHQSVIGLNERNLGLIYPNNARKNYKYADDKYLAKQLLHAHDIPCPETYATIDSIGLIEATWAEMKTKSALAIKPAKGAGGNGILILKRRGGKWYSQNTEVTDEEVMIHLANIIFGIYSFGDGDVALIEECIFPHQLFHEIYPSGVPDIRVILLKGIPLMAMLRMPTAESGGKANLHQGGLGIGVDVVSGQLKMAYDGKQHLDIHPDSKVKLTGIQLPFWAEMISMSRKAADVFPLDYLGVDLVIDQEKGPMIMELNVRPGLGIQIANQEGLKDVIAKYSSQLNPQTQEK
ncbi:MAG: sugar-transfer associated ATP-grasp domain-containing protein [Bacteroidota bacterium]